MFETVVMLKPFKEWRPGMTWEKLLAEMNKALKTPGMANIFWMPIQTRTEMLTTGFRTILGIKVFGPDLKGIEKIAVQIENALSDFPDTRSVFAERTTGGYFLDFSVNREAAARYGLRVQDVNDIIESAIGGKTIETTLRTDERDHKYYGYERRVHTRCQCRLLDDRPCGRHTGHERSTRHRSGFSHAPGRAGGHAEAQSAVRRQT
jgi:Cu/Ag efflux pump CusA